MEGRVVLSLSSVIIFLVSLVLQVEGVYHCNTHWYLRGNRCYRLFREEKDWFKAREYCMQEHDYGHLVAIKDAATQEFLEKNILQYNKDNNIWIGLEDQNIENYFFWDDSSHSLNYGYTHWANGQPKNNKNKDCVHIWKDVHYKWAVTSCDDKYHFICELPAIDTCKLPTPTTGDHGVIQSYNYPYHYINNDNCKWTISVSKGHVIKLEAHNPFYLELCCGCDYVKVYEIQANGKGILKATWCYNDQPPTFTSKTSKIVVEFKTNRWNTRPGFTATWTKVVPTCGGNFPTTADSGLLFSPNYPFSYGHSEFCKWTMDAGEGNVIKIIFSSTFDLVKYDDCTTDNVTIYDVAPDGSRTLTNTFCGKTRPPVVISSTSKVEVEFITYRFGRIGTGFSATWMKYVNPCHHKHEGVKGTIISQNYPLSYPNHLRCQWEIEVPFGQFIDLEFISFDLGKKSDKKKLCAFDKIEIFDEYGDGSLISRGQWCGSDAPPPMKSFGNRMVVEFHTDDVDGSSGQGFNATWTAVKTCGGVFHSNKGYLMSYNYTEGDEINNSNGVDSNLHCAWDINVQEGFHINLNFRPLLEKSSCKYFEVWDYNEVRDAFLLQPRWCDDAHNKQAVSLKHRMRFAFNPVMDSNVGFFATWESVCGEQFEGTSGTFSSPKYGQGNYPTSVDCEWRINGVDNHAVNLYFQSPFELETNGGDECKYDYVEVFDTLRNGYLLSKGRFCGSNPPPPLVSSHSTLVVRFHSDHDKSGRGFNATWDTACEGVYKSRQGNLTSPGFPAAYYHNYDCRWEIEADEGHVIQLSFKPPFDLRGHGSLSADYLQVYEVLDSGKLISSFIRTGQDLPAVQTFTTSKIVVVFHSDGSDNGAGFLAEWNSVCGKVLNGSEGYITSPGYPVGYGDDLNCSWEINTMTGRWIRLQFTQSFDVEYDGKCDYDDVEVMDYFSNGTGFSVGKYCGSKIPQTFISSSPKLSIHFHSDGDKSGKGFNASWETVHTCGNTFNQGEGYFMSANYPSVYPVNLDCKWEIIPPAGSTLTLTFDPFFHVEEGDDCQWDFIEIHRGNSKIGTYCGRTPPPQISFHDKIVVVFKSDRSNGRDGFFASWKTT